MAMGQMEMFNSEKKPNKTSRSKCSGFVPRGVVPVSALVDDVIESWRASGFAMLDATPDTLKEKMID